MITNPALAEVVYGTLMTPIHAANREDAILQGGSGSAIDTSVPPSSAQEQDTDLHHSGHSSSGPTREETSVPPLSAHAGDRLHFAFRQPIRRIECDNGLIYEDAPYHTSRDNDFKSRWPKDPKQSLEKSKSIKSTSSNRISYDQANDEIVIMMEHERDVFHGHVREWKDLTQEQKNVLINEFDFNPNGRLSTNRNV